MGYLDSTPVVAHYGLVPSSSFADIIRATCISGTYFLTTVPGSQAVTAINTAATVQAVGPNHIGGHDTQGDKTHSTHDC